MIRSDDVIFYIDYYRKQQKIKIYELCEGIISTRTYGRYLNNSSYMTFETIDRLLQRLNMKFFDFFRTITSDVKIKEYQLFDFAHMVRDKMYSEALTVYKKIKGMTFKTINYKKIIILNKTICDFELKEIERFPLEDMKQLIDFEHLMLTDHWTAGDIQYMSRILPYLPLNEVIDVYQRRHSIYYTSKEKLLDTCTITLDAAFINLCIDFNDKSQALELELMLEELDYQINLMIDGRNYFRLADLLFLKARIHEELDQKLQAIKTIYQYIDVAYSKNNTTPYLDYLSHFKSNNLLTGYHHHMKTLLLRTGYHYDQ
jgi:transcriptional regulator with XRE-family HTH domain